MGSVHREEQILLKKHNMRNKCPIIKQYQSINRSGGGGGGNCTEEPFFFNFKTTQLQKADWVWPKGRINYCIGYSFTDDMKNQLRKAIKHFQDHTSIQFYQIVQPYRLSEYVKFHRSRKDYSYTLGCGRRKNGGEHSVYLLDTSPVGTYIHEIMHVLGFEHEQCRQDRDEKVIINQNSLIEQNDQYQYQKRGYMLGQYDLNSIMHYRLTKNIMKLNGRYNSNYNIGQRKQLSQGDIKGIKYVYGDFSCTYDTFPDEKYEQTYYECIDCWGKGSCYGVCEVCAFLCHKGHKLIKGLKNKKIICDCGLCKHQLGLCTRQSTKLRYVRQHIFQCFDCFPSQKQENGKVFGICCNCMRKCHYGHKIRSFKQTDYFFCECGLSSCLQKCQAQG